MSRNHNMEIAETYPTGAERWVCPQCDRQLVMVWSPFKRVILYEGSQDVGHTGIKSFSGLSLQLGSASVDVR